MFDLAEAQKQLDGAVLGLFRQPKAGAKPAPSVFLTTLYSDLEIIWEENDPSLPTAATNGLQLWINPHFFSGLSSSMRVTILAHELWHIGFMHMERAGERDHSYWVMACDHAINLMLKDYGYEFSVPHLADPNYRGMTAEQIYEDLVKHAVPVNLPFGSDIQPLTGDGKSDASDEGNVTGPAGTLTPTQAQQVFSNVVRAVTMSRMSGDPPGSLPGELESTLDRLLNPRIPWFRLLRRWFQALGQPQYTLRNPNRRHAPRGHYLPGLLENEGLEHIMWACDASGSVDEDQLRVMNSEIAGVQKEFNPEQMTIVVFDTKIQDIIEFRKDEVIPPLTFKGRGGTDLVELFAYAQKRRPSALVVFSDLFVQIPPNPGIPIIWICLDNERAQVPYGTLIHMKSA